MATIMFTKQEMDTLLANGKYELYGKIRAAQKAENESELKNLRGQVNTLLGIEVFTPEQAAAIGENAKTSGSIKVNDLLNCLKNGREVSAAFKTAIGLKD